MGLLELVRAAPWRVGIAALAVSGGLAVAATPALGLGLVGNDPSGQPAPGAPAVEVDEIAPVPAQPPAGAAAVDVKRGEVAAVPAQPANPNPQSSGGDSAQVSGPDEPSSPPGTDTGRSDGGGDGADHAGGRTD